LATVRLQFGGGPLDPASVGPIRSPPSRTVCLGVSTLGKRHCNTLPTPDPAGVPRPARRQGELGDLQPLLSLGKRAQNRKGAQSCHPADLSELLAFLPARCGRRRILKSFSSNRRHVHGRCSAHRWI